MENRIQTEEGHAAQKLLLNELQQSMGIMASRMDDPWKRDLINLIAERIVNFPIAKPGEEEQYMLTSSFEIELGKNTEEENQSDANDLEEKLFQSIYDVVERAKALNLGAAGNMRITVTQPVGERDE